MRGFCTETESLYLAFTTAEDWITGSYFCIVGLSVSNGFYIMIRSVLLHPTLFFVLFRMIRPFFFLLFYFCKFRNCHKCLIKIPLLFLLTEKIIGDISVFTFDAREINQSLLSKKPFETLKWTIYPCFFVREIVKEEKYYKLS